MFFTRSLQLLVAEAFFITVCPAMRYMASMILVFRVFQCRWSSKSACCFQLLQVWAILLWLEALKCFAKGSFFLYHLALSSGYWLLGYLGQSYSTWLSLMILEAYGTCACSLYRMCCAQMSFFAPLSLCCGFDN